MPHLPNELWLFIIAQCPPADSWRALRATNQQLKACVEQFFEGEVLPHLQVAIPVALPTYDVRNPLRGQAVFQPVSPKNGPAEGRLHMTLVQTEPEYYREHFLGRWMGMCGTIGGSLGWEVKWDVQLADRSVRMRLFDARGVPSAREGEATMNFEWMATMTGFFK